MQVTLTTSSVTTLAWSQPSDVGGCSILKYAVYVDDGAAGAFTQYSTDLTPSTFTIDVAGLTYTLEYRFKIVASNHMGDVGSNIVSAIVADVPDTPINAPSFSISETDTDSNRVEMEEISANGGNSIISYHLQRTEPGGSVFFDVTGSESNRTVDTEILVRNLEKR